MVSCVILACVDVEQYGGGSIEEKICSYNDIQEGKEKEKDLLLHYSLQGLSTMTLH
jgi:hypothetical protein